MAGRPAKVVRPVEKKISLPENIVAEVDLLLHSSLEGRVPHGAWSRYIIALLEQDLQLRRQVAARSLL